MKQACGAKLYQWKADYFRALAKQHKWDINDFEDGNKVVEGAVSFHSDETLRQQRDGAVAKVAELEAKLYELEAKVAGDLSFASNTEDDCGASVDWMQRQTQALGEEEVGFSSGEDEAECYE